MRIRPIRTPEDHTAAIDAIARLWGSAPGTEEGDTLDVLATLVDAYERTLPGLPQLDAVALIGVTMTEEGYDQGDLANVLGSRSRASEILGRKRALTLPMVQKIAAAWHIPAELLIQPYPLDDRSVRHERRPA